MNKQTGISLVTLHTPSRHDSGPKHVAGTAEYIDDMIARSSGGYGGWGSACS